MMDGGYTLDPNMLVNALTRDNDGGAFGGNNGLLWIFLLILFGWGGNGFGGLGGNGAGTLVNDAAIQGQIEAALAKAQAAGLSDTTILTAIAGNKEAINSLGSYLGVQVGQIQTGINSLQSGLCQLGYENAQSAASIISAIQTGDASLSRQLADCCCATQRAIDGVNYNMERGFCNLERAMEMKIDIAQAENRAGFQGIRDYMTQEKIAALQTELQSAQLQISNNAQTTAIKEYIASYFGCPPGTGGTTV